MYRQKEKGGKSKELLNDGFMYRNRNLIAFIHFFLYFLYKFVQFLFCDNIRKKIYHLYKETLIKKNT